MEKKYKIIVMILIFIFLIFISFLFSPFFHIRDFIFHSRDEINMNDFKTTINDFYGNNLLFLNENNLKKDLLNHNLISSVKIEKSFPSTVHVIIEERSAIVWIKNNNKKLIFSADGIILAEKEIKSPLSLPQLTGFAYYFEDDKIKLPSASENLLKVLNNIEEEFLKEILKISYQNNIFKLYLAGGAGVNLGENNNLQEKFAILNSILKNNQNSKIDYINLQVIKHPVIKYK